MLSRHITGSVLGQGIYFLVTTNLPVNNKSTAVVTYANDIVIVSSNANLIIAFLLLQSELNDV